MAQNATTQTATADGVTINDNGGIHVPAHVKDALGGCYGQTLSILIPTPDHQYVSGVDFEADIHAGGGVTIPADARRAGDLSPGDVVDAVLFEQAGDPLDTEEKESLSDSPGAVDEQSESGESVADDILDEIEQEFEDVGDDAEQSDEQSESEEDSLEDLFA